MKIKLITLQLKDIDFINLKKTAKNLFKATNNPSFNIIPPFVIVGKTTLCNFKNINIEYIEDTLSFSNIIESKNGTSYISCLNPSIVNNLFNNICIKENLDFHSPYFNLVDNFENYPLILLGNEIDNKLKTNIININDYRFEIIEIEINKNYINYKILDSIHLSKDKVL